MFAKGLSGGCLCGDVRWKSEAAPISSSVCHCITCRRSSGAPMVAWIGFRRDDVKISGETTAFVSSTEAKRRHCRRCGTQLFIDDVDEPENVDITTASLDDPNAAPPDKHIWARTRLDWVKLDDGLPVYAQRSVGDDAVLLSPARNPT